jgi:small subunit ribosomal protein S1
VNHPSEVLEIGQTVEVKVLDIDRDRQRISLGLKQTQSDPWQQVVDTYSEGDVVDGKVTKVVTFGAFVEILAGVEGLVHISELAAHHVENPREIVAQGDDVKVLVLEIDGERRRLSLSLKRVEGGRAITEEEAAHLTGHIELPDDYANAAPAPELDEVDEADEPDELVAETTEDAAEGDAATVDEDLAAEPVAEVEVADEPVAEAEAEVADEPAAEAEPVAAAEAEPAEEAAAAPDAE